MYIAELEKNYFGISVRPSVNLKAEQLLNYLAYRRQNSFGVFGVQSLVLILNFKVVPL